MERAGAQQSSTGLALPAFPQRMDTEPWGWRKLRASRRDHKGEVEGDLGQVRGQLLEVYGLGAPCAAQPPLGRQLTGSRLFFMRCRSLPSRPCFEHGSSCWDKSFSRSQTQHPGHAQVGACRTMRQSSKVAAPPASAWSNTFASTGMIGDRSVPADRQKLRINKLGPQAERHAHGQRATAHRAG